MPIKKTKIIDIRLVNNKSSPMVLFISLSKRYRKRLQYFFYLKKTPVSKILNALYINLVRFWIITYTSCIKSFL